MQLHSNKHISNLIKIAYFVFGLLAVLLFFKYIFRWTIPLIISILLAMLIDKPVHFLQSKLKLPRSFSTMFCTLVFAGLISFGIYSLSSVLYSEAKALITELPVFFSTLPDKLASAEGFFEKWFKLVPFEAMGMEIASIGDLLSQIKLPQIDIGAIWSPVYKVAAGFPTLLLSVVFTFVSTYFVSSQKTAILGFLSRQLTPKANANVRELCSFMSTSVFGWIKTQCILVSITFCELLVCFSLIKQPYALLLAFMIALIDALPIFGVGTVLLPWAVFSLLTGNFVRALSFCVIYAVVLVVRNSIEPKLLGVQIGLNPFVTLLCIYFGFRMGGFGGMFLLPVTVIGLCKLHDMGCFKLYK